MKKRITIVGLCLAVSLCLCACEESDNLKDAAKGVRDVVSKYGQQIEDSKEQLQDIDRRAGHQSGTAGNRLSAG